MANFKSLTVFKIFEHFKSSISLKYPNPLSDSKARYIDISYNQIKANPPFSSANQIISLSLQSLELTHDLQGSKGLDSSIYLALQSKAHTASPMLRQPPLHNCYSLGGHPQKS